MLITNVHEVDDDLNGGFLLRLSEHQKRYKVHSFQHYYFWYCMLNCTCFGFSFPIIKNILPEKLAIFL